MLLAVVKRKVIRLAQKTLVVSLPAAWCRARRLSKGDEVSILPSGSGLHIATDTVTPAVAKANVGSSAGLARRLVSVAYKRGIDELELSFSNPAVMAAIEEELDLLMGYEIVRQTKTHCVIRSIATAQPTEHAAIENRMWFTLLEMGRLVEEGLMGNQAAFDHAIRMERVVDKLSNFCKRTLAKKPYGDVGKAFHEYAIARELEQVSDAYEHIARGLQGTKRNDAKLATLKRASEALRSLHAVRLNPIQATVNTYDAHARALESGEFPALAKKIADLANPVLAHYLDSAVPQA